jgi:predicted enzyme related to lactoylglutathione lyase
MDRNPVGWFEIYVQDVERARRFYETVLATTLSKLPSGDLEMWMFDGGPDRSGCTGAIVKATGVASGGNSTLVYFSCADCATEGGRVAGAGGRVVRDKFPIGEYGFVVLAADPDGNMFGLHSTT